MDDMECMVGVKCEVSFESEISFEGEVSIELRQDQLRVELWSSLLVGGIAAESYNNPSNAGYPS